MADMHYARPEPGRERAKFFVRLTNLTGAALSLALLAGVVVWGTKMVMRDVSGVPVVRATEGPMREAPTDPGGDAAANQGLAVNAVAAEGTAAAPADRLVLAPPPLELSLEDVAPLTQAAEVAPRAEMVEPAPQAAPEEVQNASILALADQIAAGAAPLVPLEKEVTGADAVEVPEGEDVGLAQVVRPRARPASLTSVSEAVAMAVAAARSAPSDEVDADTIPLGTRLAQLGAYDSAEVARAEWDRLSGRFGDFLDGKQRVIQRAESGGRTFYRLRAMG
ncbi:MAG: SPOR domain-containing protein, partial [Roseovarius sp.]